jgi:hypothetical protein
MPNPGPDPSFDYSEVPYKPDWQPIPDRRWALKFCKVGPLQQDDEMGFQQEYQIKVPFIYRGHSTPSWVPTVDYFVRHDAKGQRQDIDRDLAQVQKPPEIIEREEKEKKERISRQWEASKDAMIASKEASQPLETPLEAQEVPPASASSPEVSSRPRKEQKEQAQRAIEEKFQ